MIYAEVEGDYFCLPNLDLGASAGAIVFAELVADDRVLAPLVPNLEQQFSAGRSSCGAPKEERKTVNFLVAAFHLLQSWAFFAVAPAIPRDFSGSFTLPATSTRP